MLGFGAAAALFLPGVAYLGIINGHRFIDNAFFAFMCGLTCLPPPAMTAITRAISRGVAVTPAVPLPTAARSAALRALRG
nr:hypothetical protein [Streptomyces sp. N2A]